MADLKDIIAKREELMKAGNTNYTDAMAEARKQVTASQAPTPTAPTPTPIAPQPIQPAPVTPTPQVPPQPIQPAPATTPAPTQPTDWMGDFSQIKKRPFNVNDLPSQLTPEDQAKIDKMQAEGKFGQQNQVIPGQNPNETRDQLMANGMSVNDYNAFKSANPNIEPTQEDINRNKGIKTPVKPEVPVINRQQEIQNNLATGYQTNPGLFTDRAAYDKAYNYATKSPEEQATLDSFYNSKQPTISSMYSAIVNKQEVPDSTKMTPAYKIAQNRYSKASSFSSMTPSQLSDQMKNAKLVEGSQAFEDLKAINPKLVQDATNLRKVNGDTTNIWTTNTDGTKVNNLEKSIADDYTDNFGEFIKTMYKVYTPAEITAIIRTPDVVSAEDKAFAIEKSINEIDKQIANIDSEVDTEFKGSGATGSRLAMEKAARRDVLDKDRDSQVREYTTYANRASNLITQNTTSFQTQQQQQQAQNAAMLPFIQDQYKTAQAKKQAEAALADPATQIKSTLEEFSKLGVTATGSLPGKVQEAKDWIAKGGTLDGYINQMRKDLMAKDEYKAYVAKQSGTEWQSTSITRYNPSTGANESTPIFYRKKTSGGFEAVDLSGNPIDANLIGGTGGGTPSSTYPATSFTGDTTSYIASKEGFRDKAYQDSAGVWTIGYGTTRINGKPIQPGQTITQSEAQKLLGQDIASHSTWKTLIDPNTLSPAQQTALASFEYNLGPGIWNKSAMNIIDMVKSGNLKGAADEMKKYNTAGGKVVQGLVNRRNDEASMILNNSQNAVTNNQSFDSAKSGEYENYFKGTLPSGMKKGTDLYNKFINEAEAYRQTVKGKMTPDQLSIFNSQVGRFQSNPAIKNFEDQYIQTQNSVSSLDANSGPGDIASIFQFMKSLDPTSTVREGEFNLAASSAGVVQKIGNAFSRLENGQMLSNDQKIAFKSLMNSYLANKESQYNRLYEDMTRPLKNAGIDESNFPTNATISSGKQNVKTLTLDDAKNLWNEFSNKK